MHIKIVLIVQYIYEIVLYVLRLMFINTRFTQTEHQLLPFLLACLFQVFIFS